MTADFTVLMMLIKKMCEHTKIIHDKKNKTTQNISTHVRPTSFEIPTCCHVACACTCEVLDRIDCVKLALDLRDDDIVLARAAACRAGAAGAAGAASTAGAGTLSAPLGRGALGGVVRPELAAAFGGVVLPELAALVALLLGAAGMVGCQGGRL